MKGNINISQSVCGSRGYGTGDGEENSGGDAQAPIEVVQVGTKRKSKATTLRKKLIEVDKNGELFGAMREGLTKDVVKYAKSLDPRTGWEGQPKDLKKALYGRLYAGAVGILLSL